MYHTFPMIGNVLSGITASSLNEARLGYEEMGKEVHIYAPAYHPREIDEIITYVDHMVFNSFDQLDRFADKIKEFEHSSGKYIEKKGIRINPEYSEISTLFMILATRGQGWVLHWGSLTHQGLVKLRVFIFIQCVSKILIL